VKKKVAQFRFYAELNDFLCAERKHKPFFYSFNGTPSVKDVIEAIGVPHTEVDLIIVNGVSVGFEHLLQQDNTVSVYPVFESLDITPAIKLRAKPLRKTKFIIDVNLGKLASMLRMLGFDTAYQNNATNAEIITTSINEKRIILTRDQDLLKNKTVTHGYWVRATDPKQQIQEIIHRFDLRSQFKPFKRCMVCNGIIKHVDKNDIKNQVPEKTKRYFEQFYRCSNCGKIYWKGSHYKKMEKVINDLIRTTENADNPPPSSPSLF
jgi:uncharacterized protein with PIN domain